MAQRDYKIDGLKLFLIFLVVIGHLEYTDYGIMISKVAYTFHMPLFCLISGYVTNVDSDIKHRWLWVKKTFLVFVFAQTINVLLNYALGNYLSWKVLITPKFALWYLLSLIFWRIILWVALKKYNSITQIIISLALMCIMGFVPIDKEMSFQRTFAFFPFFILGHVIRKDNYLIRLEAINPYISISATVIGLVIARFFTPWFYAPSEHFNNAEDLIIRIIQTALASYLCLSILCLSRKINLPDCISTFGKYTIWIYIGHTYIVILLTHFFTNKGIIFNLIEVLLITLTICVFFIVIGVLWDKFATRKRFSSNHM